MNPTRLFLFMFLFACCINTANAQRNNVWCFGDSAGINFNTNPPSTFQSAAQSIKGSVSICDDNGNLKFYAHTYYNVSGATYGKNTVIYNRFHQKLLSGDSIYGEGFNMELAIVPFQNDTNKYYLFSISLTLNNGMRYSVIDLAANNGLGAVILKNQYLFGTTFNDGIAVALHGNGRDHWLLMKELGTNKFVKVLVDSNGISAPIYQNIGRINSGLSSMIFNSTADKLYYVDQVTLVQQFDFDRCTGLLSNPIYVQNNTGPFYAKFVGVSLSPSDRYMYLSNVDSYSDTSYVWQYDLQAPNISASRTVLFSQHIPAAAGVHALGPDGKIYISYIDQYGYFYPVDSVYTLYNQNLTVINYPDSPGVACGLAPFSFNLGGRRTYWGLPRNYNYYFTPLPGLCQPVGIEEKDKTNFEVYPNPASQYITIRSTSNSSKARVRLIDITGKIVLDKIENPVEKLIHLPVSGIANGIYTVSVQDEKSIISKRIVVQNN